MKEKCVYDLSGDYGVGWTINTHKEFYFELKHYDMIKNIRWNEQITHGVSRLRGYDPSTKKYVYMHVIIGYKNYDHIDRNELNNLESNLRPCTSSQNMMNRSVQKNNTSGIIGVCWHKKMKKWSSRLKLNSTYVYSEYFEDKEDAIKARLNAEVKYFGEFAPQKYLFEEYNIAI